MTGAWTIAPLEPDRAASLARELAVSDVAASVLVRRGYGDPDDARRFLDAALPGHDPHLLGDVAAAVERIRAAVEDGRRICVYGDYDVDGICSTAVFVRSLRMMGARAEPFVPHRLQDGYDLSAFGNVIQLPGALRSGLVLVEESHKAQD